MAENQPNPDNEFILQFQLSTYVPTHLRRQIVNSMLLVLQNFSYCSIACQLSILILDNIKTQYDVVDIVSMQKFVINEFARRHHVQHQLIMRNQEEGLDRPIRRYQIDHNNMQSAQVNQITIQLKEKIQSIQQFFMSDEEQLNQILGPNHIKY